MRLFEIDSSIWPKIDLKPKNIKISGPEGSTARATKAFPRTFDKETNKTSYVERPGIKTLGGGVSAYAVVKKNKPHEVKRISFRENDPQANDYVQFIKIILANRDNPYVPRVYSAKVLKGNYDRDGWKNYTYYFEIERLQRWTILTWKQWSQIINKVFGVSVNTFLKGFDQAADPKLFMVDKFAVKLRDAALTSKIQIVDKDLKKIISELSMFRNDFVIDLHRENIMYRITPYGAQPVITDPFYGNN